MKSQGCSEKVIQHSVAVFEKTLDLANKLTIPIDLDSISAGALLHDIGRCITHEIDHFLVGADLLRQIGFPEKIVLIVEHHIGAGLTKEEALLLGLPPKDYLPTTPEELIVSYADNLTRGTKHVPFEEAFEIFKKRIGEGSPALKRFKEQDLKIREWSK